MELNHLTEFWSQVAKDTIDWLTPWDSILTGDLHQGNIKWFSGARLNVAANCIDRHLINKANHPAIIWEGDGEQQEKILSFAQLHEEVSRMSNVLKKLGIKKGDVVSIYLPMIPEAAIAMLACARIGAIHTVIFAGFSAHALRQRLIASKSSCLITADSFTRGGKAILMKEQVNEATQGLTLKTLLVKHGDSSLFLHEHEYWWHELKEQVSKQCDPEPMEAEDPLFILYTSGSTGQPKGVVHTTGGYLVQTAYTHHHIFNCQANELFFFLRPQVLK